MINIVLIVLIIIIIIFCFFIKEHFISCDYIINKKFNTYNDCVSHCKDNKTNCNDNTCSVICNNCDDQLKCLWKTLDDGLIPQKTSIRAFSGDRCIKLNWIKPQSNFNILKYYIIVTSDNHSFRPFLEVHSVTDDSELLEYYIENLENDVIYTISVFSKNKYGISKESNKEEIITNRNSEIRVDAVSGYSDSIQSKINKISLDNVGINRINNYKSDYSEIQKIILKDNMIGDFKKEYNITID